MDGWCGEPQLSGGGMELSGPRKSGRGLSGKTTEEKKRSCWKRSWMRSSGVQEDEVGGGQEEDGRRMAGSGRSGGLESE